MTQKDIQEINEQLYFEEVEKELEEEKERQWAEEQEEKENE